MSKYSKLPTITGKKLIRLLQKDGWVIKRRARHGVALAKPVSGHTRVTIVPDSRASLDEGTLSAILGSKQTGIGKTGLFGLINRFGL